MRRVPISVDDERLLGGLDLGATLAAGRRIVRNGLLAEADGGVIVLPMAERIAPGVASRIAAAIDTGEVVTERDGVGLRADTRFVTVAFDDGVEDERPPEALLERLAFRFDLSEVRGLGAGKDDPVSGPVERGDARAFSDSLGMSGFELLAASGAALGVDSVRALQFALRAARASAVLHGRAVGEDDLALGVRLVLVPRATRMPAPPEEAGAPPPDRGEGAGKSEGDPQAVEDRVLAAALASLPADVLARLAAGGGRSRNAARGSGGGERRKSPQRGRPAGTRAGIPRGGLRLSLIDTLRAAAPWQRLRGGGSVGSGGRVRIRKDDLRVRRFETRAEALTIFAVDASGSAALARLAEAKGAVELLLGQAYVRRAQVALVAFRGTAAELLLPPTRSLARARRSLSELPGGGGTPIAAGLAAARELAEAARARGRTPFLVVLTDGRANVALDGGTVREAAERDAHAAALAIGASGIATAFVDISPRPRPEGAKLAAAMRARYLPLPKADAHAMHAAVLAAAP
jgi:magnesium chelatase subunit D